MFLSFQVMTEQLHGKFLSIYWTILPSVVVIVILLELFKGEIPAPDKILRRVFISVLLILSFDHVQKSILYFTDRLALKIQGFSKLNELTALIEMPIKSMDIEWFAIRKSLIYLLGYFSYLYAYIGVFSSQAVIQFAWAILVICSPLMIMAYISERTASVTSNLYRGLIHVGLWKVLAAILGVLLLEFAKTPSYNQENLLTVIIINLCIASSLLLVPFTLNSLLGDGLIGSASVMAALPGILVTKFLKRTGSRVRRKATTHGVKFLKNRFGKKKIKKDAEKNLKIRPSRKERCLEERKQEGKNE